MHNFNLTLQHFVLLNGIVKVGHTGAHAPPTLVCAPPSFQKPFSTDLTPQINSPSEINDMTIIIYTNKLIYVVSKLTIVTQQKFSPAYYVLPLGSSAVINFASVFQLFGALTVVLQWW